MQNEYSFHQNYESRLLMIELLFQQKRSPERITFTSELQSLLRILSPITHEIGSRYFSPNIMTESIPPPPHYPSRCLRILPTRSLTSREERGWGWGWEAVVDPRLPIRGRQRRINGGYMKNCGGSPSSVWSHPPLISLQYTVHIQQSGTFRSLILSKFCFSHPIIGLQLYRLAKDYFFKGYET